LRAVRARVSSAPEPAARGNRPHPGPRSRRRSPQRPTPTRGPARSTSLASGVATCWPPSAGSSGRVVRTASTIASSTCHTAPPGRSAASSP